MDVTQGTIANEVQPLACIMLQVADLSRFATNLPRKCDQPWGDPNGKQIPFYSHCNIKQNESSIRQCQSYAPAPMHSAPTTRDSPQPPEQSQGK